MTIAINLMMLGPTGSGKTTFIHNFAYSLPRMTSLGRTWKGKIVEIRHKTELGVDLYNPFTLDGASTPSFGQYTFAFNREWVGDKRSETKSEIEKHRLQLTLADNPGGDIQKWFDGNGRNKEAITIGEKFKSAHGLIAVIEPLNVLTKNGEIARKLLQYVRAHRTKEQFLAICYNHAKASSNLPLEENELNQLVGQYFRPIDQQQDRKMRKDFIVPAFQDNKANFQEAALSPFFWILDQCSEVAPNARWSL